MSLLNTLKLEIRAKVPAQLDRQEWRFTRYGLLTAALEMTNSPLSVVSNDLKQKALQSQGRALKVPVFKYGDVTVNNVRSCNIGNLDNETEMVNITWVTLSADMSMKKAEYFTNEVDYLTDLDKKLRRIEDAFARALEQMIYTRLDTDKSAVYNSPLIGTTYSLVANTIQVPALQQEYFFNDLEAILEGDDFYTMPLKVLGSTTLKPAVKHWGQQGQANDENLQYQFDGYDFRFSNNVVNGAGVKATGFCMPDGSIGILTRNAIDSLMKNKASDGTEWGITKFDRLGFDVGYMYKSKCTDLSAESGLSHLSASMIENYQFSFDVALVTPYNSDPVNNPGGIKKFEFLP